MDLLKPLIKPLFKTLFGRRPPTHAGELRVEGCPGPVTVRRDRYGVPYIEAGSELDAWYGLGFCHAQDRMGQLEFVLRVVRGTLAEAVGHEGLAADRLSRRIGFRRAAAAQLPLLAPEVRTQVEAYAAGLNAGLVRGCARPAHELLLLRRDPTPWEPVDVQASMVFFCFVLASNWDMELLRLKVLEQDGPEALQALEPPYPAHLSVSSPPGAAAGDAADRLARDLATFRQLTGGGGASNGWVVSPGRSATGRPILANDLHLGPGVPNLSYLARLSWPGGSVAGASMAGLPAFAPGHNGHAAWGITAAHADNTDLFLEELGDDGRSVRGPDGGFAPCPVVQEEIPVKGDDPAVERVLLTPRGPIISPGLLEPPGVGRGENGQAGAQRAISISASWLQPRPNRGLYRVHEARSFEQCRAGFTEGSTSAATVVYADTSPSVGWFMAVELPRRRSGLGQLPLPGWDRRAGWEDAPLPFHQLPREQDPEQGFVCTANNAPVAQTDGGPFFGLDWLDGYRATRLSRVLAARDDWDLRRTLRLQLDTLSIPWQELREGVLAVDHGGDPDARQALALLRRWDGRVSSGSVGASIYELFMATLCRRLVRAKAPRAARWALGQGFSPFLPFNLILTRRLGHMVDLLRRRPDGFWGRPWEDEIRAALTESVATLRRRRGADTADWCWGDVRPLRLPHPFGGIKPLDQVFNLGPLPGVGDSGTVVQGSVTLADPLDNQLSLPMLRAVIDVGRWDDCRFSLCGGQSGNPFSENYADLLPSWQSGEGIPIAWSEEQVQRRTVQTLTLL